MSFTQRIFTDQECDKIYDLSQKVGSSSDKGKRFTFMDQSDSSDENQQQMVSNFYDTFFDMLAKNSLYSGSLVPDSSSTPNVYTSTEELGEEWGWHRDDFKTPEADMMREWTVILSLNDPEEYDDGEVIILGGGSESVFKMPKGWICFAPSAQYVKFNKVTKGRRILMRWAVESLVKDPREIELLTRYTQLYHAFKENLSGQADDLFSLANNMLLNYMIREKE
tara:strand:+ start:261 stop:929 length:669 start_codon:yes stop_codon:yes gene_type:complete